MGVDNGRNEGGPNHMTQMPPLNEAISVAVAQLFADDPVNRRDPNAKPRDPSHQALNGASSGLD
jgi:hypothetical protein